MPDGCLELKATGPAHCVGIKSFCNPSPNGGAQDLAQLCCLRGASAPRIWPVHRVTGWFLCPAFVHYSLRLFGSEAVLGAVVYATARVFLMPPLYLGGVGTWGDYHDAFPARVWS